MSADVRFINPPGLAPTPGYTQVVEARGGRTIFVSGQIPLDSFGNIVGEGDLEAQTRQIFENIDAALKAADADFDDVVKLGFFLTDISRIPETRSVRDEFVNTENPPASTAVEVRRLVLEEFMIEVEAVAVAAP